jgi:hypothetical protein
LGEEDTGFVASTIMKMEAIGSGLVILVDDEKLKILI